MRRIEATFKIVTPMFLGDAEQNATGIRPPSIKGALRFWWRALNWKTAMEQRDHDEDRALQWLHQEEARLFGAAAKEEKGKQLGGQGVFLLRVKEQPRFMAPVTDWPRNPLPIDGSTYLAFGITESGSPAKGNYKPHRKGIPENLTFSIELAFKPDVAEGDIKTIKSALEAFGLLGGLGSRSRRGLGSVALKSLDGKNYEMNKDAYLEKLEALFKQYAARGSASNYPPFTAITQLSKLRMNFNIQRQAREAHRSIGGAYKDYRGQSSTLRGREKVPFGIPLQGVSKNEERRSSPLFFHIHQINEGFFPIAYYIPADFHPSYETDSKTIHGFYEVVRKFMEAKT